MPWFIFALITPFLYSFNNYFDKFVVTKKIKNPVNLTIFSGILSGFIGIIIFFLKGFPILSPIQTAAMLLSGMFLILYLIPYFKALSLDEASRIIPIFQTIPVFILILSYFLLKESLSIKQLLGFVIILGASFAIMMNKLDTGLFKPRPALWYMLISSAMYAVLNVLFRFVVRQSDYWTTFSYQYLGIGIGALILYLFFINKSQFKKDTFTFKSLFGFFAGSSSISILANMSETYAISLAPVALVSIVSGTQPLFVLILGIILSLFFPKIIKEDIKKSTIFQKILAIVFIFVGLYVVYF
jgi:drug/metabolite transporter (DMT)-like permease